MSRSILSTLCMAALPLLLCPILLSAGTKGADPKAARCHAAEPRENASLP